MWHSGGGVREIPRCAGLGDDDDWWATGGGRRPNWPRWAARSWAGEGKMAAAAAAAAVAAATCRPVESTSVHKRKFISKTV